MDWDGNSLAIGCCRIYSKVGDVVVVRTFEKNNGKEVLGFVMALKVEELIIEDIP